MSARTVVVAHPEALAAEGIAAALARFPALVPVGIATTAAEVLRRGERTDAVALDARLPGAVEAASRLRRKGVRVVVMDDEARADEDGEVRVPTGAPVSYLASVLVPGAAAARSRVAHLTPREHEVLSLVSKGMAGKQVARFLGISPKTVEQYKTRIFDKLGVRSQTAAVALALSEGSPRWIPSST